MTKIVGIGGSLCTESYSMQGLHIAAKNVKTHGTEVEILDLRNMTLPFCDGGDDYPDYPKVLLCCNYFCLYAYPQLQAVSSLGLLTLGLLYGDSSPSHRFLLHRRSQSYDKFPSI